MKEFAVLLLLALVLNGCGDNHVPNPQVAAGASGSRRCWVETVLHPD